MNKMYKKLILLLITAIAIFAVSLTSAYAWYVGFVGLRTDSNKIKLQANASYYAGGNGTKNNPYIISNGRHLYNFAWLQDLGYYDEDKDSDESLAGIQPYYFKLGSNIDMSELSYQGVQAKLPPIGITQHPFVGNFDGAGYTISNLIVTTDFADVIIKPSSNVLEDKNDTIINNVITTDYLGMFGYIGSKTLKTNLDTEVTNYTLANATVGTSKTNILSGFIAGYADNDISKIGVANSHFDFSIGVTNLSNQNYISNYGLIGDYNFQEGAIAWEDKPTKAGVGYGSSTDLRQLYISLGSVEGNAIGKNEAYPFRSETGIKISRSSNTIRMNLSAGAKDIETTVTQKASTNGNNLGYFVGSDIKIYANKSNIDYSKFYYPQDSGHSLELPYNSGGVKHNAPSEDIVKYLTEELTADDGTKYTNGKYLMRMSGSSQIDFINEKGLYAVPNAQVGEWTGNLLVPNRVIWVAPVKTGTMKFVLFNPESKAMGFRLYKLTRSTPKNYSTYFSAGEQVIECNATLLPLKAYYFEQEITQEDIDEGYEYALSAGDGYNPYIAYMDIGVNGSSVSKIGNIANIDWVYEDPTQENGYSQITETNLSGVGFQLEGKATSSYLLYIFRSASNGVLYVTTGNGITTTAFGKSATKKDSISEFN
ncbi:MAG: hypothetical protein K6G28_04000 [Acholeplasmatales bacterium]|nr:hypothetical protein [Acholeplasmatales bacterium]